MAPRINLDQKLISSLYDMIYLQEVKPFFWKRKETRWHVFVRQKQKHGKRWTTLKALGQFL